MRWVAAAIAVLALAGCAGKDVTDPTAGSKNRYVAGEGTSKVYAIGERKAAPSVTGELLDGGTYDLARKRGKVVVINFWASWCAPCRLETGALEETHKATGVEFLGVDIRDGKDAAKAFVAGRMTYPSIFDPAGKVALGFTDVPPNTIPATLVIDKQGRVAAVFRKAIQRSDLEPVIKQISNE